MKLVKNLHQSVSDLLANDKSLYGTLRKKGWIKVIFTEL